MNAPAQELPVAGAARVVLACRPERSNRQIAEQLRVTPQTVGKWRTRFAQKRLDGLLDEPRPAAPRTIGDTVVERVIAKILHEKPRAVTHWSSRTMAKAAGVSQTALVRIWYAFGLQPHGADTFKLSTDSLFIEKVRDNLPNPIVDEEDAYKPINRPAIGDLMILFNFERDDD